MESENCLAGITPAYAGKRNASRSARALRRDHPRICGEKRAMDGEGNERKGSPPHMRGKGEVQSNETKGNRITPAYAGKSTTTDLRPVLQQDHPRICGEKDQQTVCCITAEGSPPHMRGKANLSRKRHRAKGITPAYAGKRLPRQMSLFG